MLFTLVSLPHNCPLKRLQFCFYTSFRQVRGNGFGLLLNLRHVGGISQAYFDSVRITRFLEQGFCFCRIKSIGLKIRCVAECPRADRTVAKNSLAVEKRFVDKLAVNGVVHCLAYAYVIKGRLIGVYAKIGHYAHL